MKTPIQNKKQLEFDMVVYHTKVYNGNEPLKVVGIRKSEVELYGDYSGVGLTYGSSWLPLDGVLIQEKENENNNKRNTNRDRASRSKRRGILF